MGMIKNPQSNLPPGFRFHPTDEELILHYLKKKLTSSPFPLSIIADVDIYKFDPWDLPAKAPFGEKEWYFFSPRDRKYPNGARPNRAAASGYWKATGTDKIIVASSSSMYGGIRGGCNGGGGGVEENLGVKKALVFYKGRPPKGIKTNWIMHEYRLADSPTSYGHKPINKPKDSSSTSTMRLDDWVLCRIYKKTHASTPSTIATAASDQDQELEEDQEEHQSMLQQTINKNPMILPQKSSSFSNLLDAMDYSFLSSILADNNQFNQTGFDSLNPSLPYTTNATLIDQPFSTTTGYCNTSTGFTKLPGLNSTTTPFMPDNKLKRPLFTIDEETDTKRRNNTTTEEEFSRNASKALVNCCSFSNSSTQLDHVAHQYNFLNQQLLLSPHLQFQG